MVNKLDEILTITKVRNGVVQVDISISGNKYYKDYDTNNRIEEQL